MSGNTETVDTRILDKKTGWQIVQIMSRSSVQRE
jgi:hypothetical protein